MQPANDFPGTDTTLLQVEVVQCGGGERWKRFLGIVLSAPAIFDTPAQFAKYFHRGLIVQSSGMKQQVGNSCNAVADLIGPARRRVEFSVDADGRQNRIGPTRLQGAPQSPRLA